MTAETGGDDTQELVDALVAQTERPHVVLNLPVIGTGIAGAWQLVAGVAPSNFAATVDRNTQVAVAVLFIISALLVVAGWIGNRSKCEMRKDRGLRVKGTGLVGWSVGMLAYLAATWGLMDPSQFFSSPAVWIAAALIPSTLHRAWALLRPVRRRNA